MCKPISTTTGQQRLDFALARFFKYQIIIQNKEIFPDKNTQVLLRSIKKVKYFFLISEILCSPGNMYTRLTLTFTPPFPLAPRDFADKSISSYTCRESLLG